MRRANNHQEVLCGPSKSESMNFNQDDVFIWLDEPVGLIGVDDECHIDPMTSENSLLDFDFGKKVLV